ncbi:hypothetical protein CSA08_01710, partial [Candidatus Gracilibacteria bacterium]
LKRKHHEDIDLNVKGLNSYNSDESKIIEGVFTGSDMLGSDGNKHPVPANYASKSKLVQGDKLKLTVNKLGKMLYKQIQPIERETKVGILTKEKGVYQVLADGEIYGVLTAAVTHFKAEIGDNVAIIVPAGKKATFAAIDNIIPKDEI